MDVQNHYYGHSAALALAAGLERPRHIAGLVQHGWTVVSPTATHMHDFPQVGTTPRWRLFVWTHSSRAWDPQDEVRRTEAIGSPFLYLLREARNAGWHPERTGATVWIPFHGTRLMKVEGDHVALARQVADREGACRVCLHVDDASDPEIVRAWTAAGHELVTAGRRHDADFLARILTLVAGADRVASNRLSTAVMYAAAAGKDVAVYGPPMTFGGDDERGLQRIRDTWPEFHGDSCAVEETTKLAEAELGANHLLPPSDLRTVLGWDGAPRRRAAAYYWLASSVRKAGAVLGRGAASGSTPPAGSAPSPLAFLRHPLEHLPSPLPRGVPKVPDLAAPLPVGQV